MDPQTALTNALLGQNQGYNPAGASNFSWNSQGQTNASQPGWTGPAYGSQPMGQMGTSGAYQWQMPGGMWVGNPNMRPRVPQMNPHGGQALGPGQPHVGPQTPPQGPGSNVNPSLLNQTPNHQVF